MHQHLQAAREAEMEQSMPQQAAVQLKPHATSLDDDLQQAALVLPLVLKPVLCFIHPLLRSLLKSLRFYLATIWKISMKQRRSGSKASMIIS
jgi:hypothetical protein